MATMQVTAVPQQQQRGDGLLKPTDAAASDTYMLQCGYCDWSTLDIDVVFSKPTKITEQLAKQRTARIAATASEKGAKDALHPRSLDHDDAFTKLIAFYKEQLNESGEAGQTPYGSSPYSSPANLARIMSMYGGLSATALKKSREKPSPMREARDPTEGSVTYSPESDHEAYITNKLQSLTRQDTTTSDQRHTHPLNNSTHFTSDLWPVATQLRTRRGKRCKTCRQFVARPDTKVSALRYKIRISALNHIPRLLFRPLHPPTPPIPNQAFRLRAEDPVQADLKVGVKQEYVLTIRNPIFETIRVTLATPGVTPGKVASRVTILCPSFTVGAAGDVWDEALGSSISGSSRHTNDGGRQAAMASLTGKSGTGEEGAEARQPEAGKIWERTRNSTSVIVEIVPGQLQPPPSIVPMTEEQAANEELEEDDDVLEVPIFVRADWEAPEDAEGGKMEVGKRAARDGVGMVKKELAFWCVLGVGRIAG